MRDEIIRVIVLLYCKDVPVEQANREFCLDNWKKLVIYICFSSRYFPKITHAPTAFLVFPILDFNL